MWEHCIDRQNEDVSDRFPPKIHPSYLRLPWDIENRASGYPFDLFYWQHFTRSALWSVWLKRVALSNCSDILGGTCVTFIYIPLCTLERRNKGFIYNVPLWNTPSMWKQNIIFMNVLIYVVTHRDFFTNKYVRTYVKNFIFFRNILQFCSMKSFKITRSHFHETWDAWRKTVNK